MSTKLAIIIPCYNEQEVLPMTIQRINSLLCDLMSERKIDFDSFALYVDDGSSDRTWEIIEEKNQSDNYTKGLKLAANSGHQNALLAGLEAVSEIADITVTIDADLQDDERVIEKMIDAYNDGCDIVYGVRSSRKNDSFFKRTTAQGFYKIMNVMGAKTVYNHADFRLMSKRAVKQLLKYNERNMFLRGIVPLIGYKTAMVEYARTKRVAGESKYPLRKMIAFAFEGITSFSAKPITLILGLGFIIVILTLAAMIYALVAHFAGTTVPGWTSLMLSIWFLGGVQLISVGLIGKYVGKIYIESKQRPRYNIEKSHLEDKDNTN
ncbi:MAG: glycosyltransferase family 2 protein [Clostridia bacterium]|nr:glycosyltransferase family 2 protein [Clostridia bacterium]